MIMKDKGVGSRIQIKNSVRRLLSYNYENKRNYEKEN